MIVGDTLKLHNQKSYKMVLHFDNFRFNSNTTDGTSGVAWTVYISGASEFIPSFLEGGGVNCSIFGFWFCSPLLFV
jgi:hypothetical protein